MGKLDFQHKLTLYFFLIISAVIIFIMAGFYYYSYRNLSEQAQLNLDQLSVKTTAQLDNLITDMDRLCLYVSTNSDIRVAFREAAYQDLSNSKVEAGVLNTLTTVMVPNSAFRFRISLYNKKGNYVSAGIAYDSSVVNKRLHDQSYASWYKNLPIKSSMRSVTDLHKDYWGKTNQSFFSLLREIPDVSLAFHTTGVVEIQCPYEQLASILNFSDGSTTAYLYNQNGGLVYPENTSVPEEVNAFAAQAIQQHASAQKGVYLCSADRSAIAGWTVVLAQPKSKNMTPFFNVILLSGIFGLCMIAISFYLVFFVSTRVTKPLKKLRKSVQNVDMTNMSVKVDTKGSADEFTELNLAFEQMFGRLHDSMDEIVKIKGQEMQAHMIALQAQMDPHFLYNMIAIIKAMSREANAPQIGGVCNCLANMLRYISCYSEDAVTVEEELNHVENYLKLMKVRYEDQFSYCFEIDPNLRRVPLPRLSLQPIVENCFQHGFKQVQPPWTVRIRGWQEDNRWYLSVTDNGGGFPSGTMEGVEKKVKVFLSDPSGNIQNMKIGGMGLVNTIVRLKLRNQDSIIWKMENLPQGGAKVTLGGVCDDEYFTG